MGQMQKILLYYKFIPLADPEAVRLWQRALCASLNLKGRILLSPHGINGTLGGDTADLKAYAKETKAYFTDMEFKWSDGGREHFPKLSVKVRPEIVTFGAAGELQVDGNGVVGGGKRLTPAGVHELVQSRGEDVVFFDGRNAYEAEVGRFKGAVVPRVAHTRDFMNELEDPKYEALKDKPVVTYCTGGIRCEVLSALMKNRGFKEVYQLDGGIATYGEAYGDEGLWEGGLYVFDGRLTVKFTDKAKDIADCAGCGVKTSDFVNCANVRCNRLLVMCRSCAATRPYCGQCRPQAAPLER